MLYVWNNDTRPVTPHSLHTVRHTSVWHLHPNYFVAILTFGREVQARHWLLWGAPDGPKPCYRPNGP